MSRIAMNTALSGMTAHARRLDVIGNNIANANTTAFKSSRTLFSDQFSWLINRGNAPADTTGGSNPTQVGLGVQIAGTQRNFNPGSVTQTGDSRDLAIEGRGFFMVQQGSAESPETLYTRAGSFRPDHSERLVTADGDPVLGYAIDSNFNINRNALAPISVPVGRLGFAEATQTARMSGNLKADGPVATQGSSLTLGATSLTGFRLIPSATQPATAPAVIEPASLVREIADPFAPSLALFSPGQQIEVGGVDRGKTKLPERTLDITATTTVDELMTFLRDALAINAAHGQTPAGQSPGVSLNTATGNINVTGNTGSINDLTIDNTDIRLRDASGTFLRNPFAPTKNAAATGESVRTSFQVYDSLGNPVDLKVGMVLTDRGVSGTAWRYEIDSADNPGLNTNLSFGTTRFDTLGQLQSDAAIAVSLDRSQTGAGSPQNVTVRLADSDGVVTALSSRETQLINYFRDGAAFGRLSSFGVERDGTVRGSFTNGQTRPLGQIAVATFANPEGLVAEGGNLFRPGANSGAAVVNQAGTGGSGRILGGALEASNVDLSTEFVDLLQTQTGYSASSRVIRTADELLQQLLVLGR